MRTTCSSSVLSGSRSASADAVAQAPPAPGDRPLREAGLRQPTIGGDTTPYTNSLLFLSLRQGFQKSVEFCAAHRRAKFDARPRLAAEPLVEGHLVAKNRILPIVFGDAVGHVRHVMNVAKSTRRVDFVKTFVEGTTSIRSKSGAFRQLLGALVTAAAIIDDFLAGHDLLRLHWTKRVIVSTHPAARETGVAFRFLDGLSSLIDLKAKVAIINALFAGFARES